MNNNGCIVEDIILMIDEIQESNCNNCSVCREGRQWIRELITRKVNEEQNYSKNYNFLVEMGHYIWELSDCEKGKKLGQLIVEGLCSKKLDYFFHLETGKCRRLL